MKILLCDLNGKLIDAWRKHFDSAPQVSVVSGSIMNYSADAIVSPANSFGFMDGGIDQIYTDEFGPEVQNSLQGSIRDSGELLIGDARLVQIRKAGCSFRFMIAAPTMRFPMTILDIAVVRLATRAALALAKKKEFKSIIFPGMGTGCGKVAPDVAARQMRMGYNDVFQPKPFPRSWSDLYDEMDEYGAFNERDAFA